MTEQTAILQDVHAEPAAAKTNILEPVLIGLGLVAMVSFGFFNRFIEKPGNVVDSLFVGLTVLALMGVLLSRTTDEERPIWLALVFLAISAFASMMLTQKPNSFIQFGVYAIYLTPLLMMRNISPRVCYFALFPILLGLSAIQLPLDVIFPRDLDITDAYSGTFTVANNKSRFLCVMLWGAWFVYARQRIKSMGWLIIFTLIASASLFIGDSMFVYLIGVVAAITGLFHRRPWGTVGVVAAVIGGLVGVFHFYGDEPLVYFTYNRFFDTDHGAYAVVLYIMEVLKETWFLGGGLGEFASRVSQSQGGLYLGSIPRTMITYGQIYETTVAPSGLPSYLSIIAEAGIMGLAASCCLIWYIYKAHVRTYMGFALMIFLFALTLFLPMFFESPDCILFLYVYLIINKARQFKTQQPREAT